MARPGKYQLSLSQLAEFDDLLTDALVDRVYYWTKIRKMKHSYHPNRGIKTEEVVKVIVHEVVRNKNTAGALQKFLELNGVKQYLNKVSNKSPNAEADFVKHARRYLSMYSPDAGFEVSSTNRYNPLSPEASIISRRPFRRGDTIKYLTGAMVRMSSAEEDAFTHGATDFSIIYSSRVGGMSLLLGPARFVNHDCEPNAKFVTTNKDNVTLVVERDVEVGEEVTVKYADDYFGEGNKECLCRTCETQMRNGWAGDVAIAEGEEEIDIDSLVPGAIITRRSSRKKLSGGAPAEVEETLEQVEKRNRDRSRRKSALLTAPNQILSPPDSSRGMSVEAGFGNSLSATPSVVGGPEDVVNTHTPAPEGSEEQGQVRIEEMRPMTPPKTSGTGTPAVAAATEVGPETEAVVAGEPLSDAITESLPGALEQVIKAEEVPGGEDAKSAGKQEDTVMENMDPGSPATTIPDSVSKTPEPSTIYEIVELDLKSTIDITKSFGLSAPLSALSVNTIPTNNSLEPTISEDEELSDFTDIDDNEIDDSILTVPLLKKIHKKSTTHKGKKLPKAATVPLRRSSPVSTTASAPAPPGIIEPPRTRVPGDYLSWHLNTGGTKCVCSDCRKTFVHDDPWYVPRACKRCERHSKIYGLVWPKTLKRKNDSEEQIDDHRLIQRYVTASEHRKERKKLEEESVLAGSVRAKRRASYNPPAATTNASKTAGARKRKRVDVDVEQEMEDIDGVFDVLKRVGRGGKRSKLEPEVIR